VNDAEFRRRAHALLDLVPTRDAAGLVVRSGVEELIAAGPASCPDVDVERLKVIATPERMTHDGIAAARFLLDTPAADRIALAAAGMMTYPRPAGLPEWHCGSAGCAPSHSAENPCVGSPAWRPKP